MPFDPSQLTPDQLVRFYKLPPEVQAVLLDSASDSQGDMLTPRPSTPIRWRQRPGRKPG